MPPPDYTTYARDGFRVTVPRGGGLSVLRQALFRLSQERHLRDLATQNGLGQRMARRFVAGETLEDGIAAVREINRRGMSASLDHLGENVSTRDEALQATDTYIALLRRIAEAEVHCNISIKLTQLGLDLDEGLAFDNACRVVDQAAGCDNFVRIDMEGSAYVARTLEIFYRLFERCKNVGVVIQAYLYRSERDLEQLIDVGARVRLVKGAYLEPPAIAMQRKEDVDANFVRLAEMLLARGTYPAMATHDERMIAAVRRYAGASGIDSSRFEFQMLFGVRRDLQHNLVRDGYNMRVYVPYGTSWYPYLMRRMAERPANVMFVLGSLARERVASRR